MNEELRDCYHVSGSPVGATHLTGFTRVGPACLSSGRQAAFKNMLITRTICYASCLAAALWVTGCFTNPNDTRVGDAIKGWTCLFTAHDFANPFNQMPSEPPLAYANFCEQHKVILVDAQSYISREMAPLNPPSPPHVFIDIFANVEGGAVYESGTGDHGITYDVYIKEKDTDWDGVYLLLYDRNDKRTKVIFTKHHHPSRGFGQIKTKFWMECDHAAKSLQTTPKAFGAALSVLIGT
jgi:hypothetical protein